MITNETYIFDGNLPVAVSQPSHAILWGTTILTLFINGFILLAYIETFSTVKKQYPNLIMFHTVLANIITQTGFLMGCVYDWIPNYYQGTWVCDLQWFLIGTFGLCSLFLLFAYMFGLYELVVGNKKSKLMAHKQNYVIFACYFFALFFANAVPYMAPFVDINDPSLTFIMWAQGPWCGPRNLVVLFMLFYATTVPLCFAMVYFAFRIIHVVRATTQKVKRTVQQSSGNIQSKKSNLASKIMRKQSSSVKVAAAPKDMHTRNREAAKKRLNRFYLRIVAVGVLYSVLTIAAAARRFNTLVTVPPEVLFDSRIENDPALGISILLPFLSCLMSAVILTTPTCQQFYSKYNPFIATINSASKTQTATNENENTTMTGDGDNGGSSFVYKGQNVFTELRTENTPSAIGAKVELAPASFIFHNDSIVSEDSQYESSRFVVGSEGGSKLGSKEEVLEE